MKWSSLQHRVIEFNSKSLFVCNTLVLIFSKPMAVAKCSAIGLPITRLRVRDKPLNGIERKLSYFLRFVYQQKDWNIRLKPLKKLLLWSFLAILDLSRIAADLKLKILISGRRQVRSGECWRPALLSPHLRLRKPGANAIKLWSNASMTQSKLECLFLANILSQVY